MSARAEDPGPMERAVSMTLVGWSLMLVGTEEV